MKRFLTLTFLLTILNVFLSIAMLHATSIIIEGTGETTYYMYDENLNQLFSAKTNEKIELESGDYIVKLNNCLKKVSIQDGVDTILKAGRVNVSGTGMSNYYVFKDLKMQYISYTNTNKDIELLPGTYCIKLNNTFQTVEIYEGQQTQINSGVITVLGTGIYNFYVLDIDMNQLAYANTNKEIEIFPGNYLLLLNKTFTTASVKESQKTIVKSGAITVTGIGSTNYYVYNELNVDINNGNDINIDGKVELQDAISVLQILTNLDTINNVKIVLTKGCNFQNIEHLCYAQTNKQLELFPGKYTLQLNKTFCSAEVEEGQNTIVRSGSLSVSGNGSSYFYVYNSNDVQLAYNNTNKQIELFPGSYKLQLNKTSCISNVTEGQNTIVKSGTISVSGNGSAYFYVYDNNNVQLSYANTNKQIELFPGDYKLKLNNTFCNGSITEDQHTIVRSGTVSVSGDGSNYYYVYDPTYFFQLSYNSTNKQIELLPGQYIVKYSETTKIADVDEEQNTQIEFTE